MTDHQSTLRELIAQWAGSSRIALDLAKQFRAKGNTGAAGRAEERSIVFDICAQGLRALLSAEEGRQPQEAICRNCGHIADIAERMDPPAEDGRKDEETLRDAARRFKAAWEARQQGIDHDGALASDVTAARKKLFALASRPAAPQETTAALASRAVAPQDGVALIAAERRRQVEAEGWTPEHDDTHRHGELAFTAARYALHDVGAGVDPSDLAAAKIALAAAGRWDSCWWKPRDAVRNLVRAGALIAAEIDRLKRAASSPERPTPAAEGQE